MNWLEQLLTESDMKPAELARLSHLDQGLISRLRSGKTEATPATLKAIAKATKRPEEEIFRRAGILTTKSKLSPLAERAAHLVESLENEQAREMIVDLLETYVTKENRKVIAVKRQTP